MSKGEVKIGFRKRLSDLFWIVKFTNNVSRLSYISIIVLNGLNPFFSIAISFLFALILNDIVKVLSTDQTGLTSRIFWEIFGIFVFSGLQKLSYKFTNYFEMRLNFMWDNIAWQHFMRKLANLDIAVFESSEFNILLQKSREALNWRAKNSALSVIYIFSNIIAIVLSIGVFATINPIIIVLVIVPVSLNYFLNKRFGQIYWSFWDTKGDTKINAWHAQEAFTQKNILMESKIYNFSEFIVTKYAKFNMEFITSMLSKVHQKGIFEILIVILDEVIYFAIHLWLVIRVLTRNILVGEYTFTISNISSISSNLSQLERNLSDINENIGFLYDLRKFFEYPAVINHFQNPIKVDLISPEIEFENVSFKYPKSDKFILKNINFKLKKGEKIALVGKNGAGKTTIVKLLARFYDPTEGRILINGKDLKEIDLGTYYKLWGILLQQYAQFWFSAGENISIGNLEDQGDQQLIEIAARKADADDFIKQLPHKYDTILSTAFKDGTELSGGQWQKIGIARAFFASPKFIVLDEPTSNLDALSELEVFENINKLSSEATVLIISHRFATVRSADHIIVLEDGKIVEEGSHVELIANKGLYAEMFEAQAKGYRP